jgi:hypothetical protein
MQKRSSRKNHQSRPIFPWDHREKSSVAIPWSTEKHRFLMIELSYSLHQGLNRYEILSSTILINSDGQVLMIEIDLFLKNSQKTAKIIPSKIICKIYCNALEINTIKFSFKFCTSLI